MKHLKITHDLFIIALAFTLAACTKSSADDNPNPRPGSGSPEEPTDTEISSIQDLNTTQGYLNSHATEWSNSSLEMNFRSYVRLQSPQLIAINARYPRIKRLANNTYILLYQQGVTAQNVYYARSNNLVSWQAVETPLFAKTNMQQYESTLSDVALFTSADAIVLDNGDILAFASFRLNDGYRLNPLNNGIMMRRSTNNGLNWGAPEVIYRGVTWEPSAVQLSSKEIQVYFTDSSVASGDSGTSMLRSTDRGVSWTTVGKVARQEAGIAADVTGAKIFTDQMPSAIELNGTKRIALAFESRFGRTGTSADRYNVGLAYSSDNWASAPLTDEDEGPAERQWDLFKDQAAPYLRQFRSGETALSSNINALFNIRLGDSKAWEFGSPMQAFAGIGSWGSIEIIDDHTLVGVYPEAFTSTINDTQTDCARILLARFVLNHRINATAFTPEITGSSKAWINVNDALFIGSVSQAQASFRFAYDADNLYCLVERLDKNLTTTDGVDLMIQSGNATGDPLTIKIKVDENTGTLVCNNGDVKCAATVLGTFDETENDRGYVIELAIPRSKIAVVDDQILFNAILHDTIGDDTFTGLTTSNYGKWFPVVLKEPTEPQPEPEPGDGDNGQGPQWGNGDETNPWK